jgi:hypothetical protein
MISRRAAGLAAAGLAAAGVGLATPANAAQASMALSPTTATVVRGHDVALTVKVNTGGQSVNANQFFLNLPAGLHCASVIPATTAWPNSFLNTCTDTTAALVVYSNGGTSYTGTGTLATVHLTAVSSGKAVVAFDPAKSLVAVVPGIDAHATLNRATITVR